MAHYYTDGSASPNPGPGGYAVILDGQPVALGREGDSTNIRMEAQALIAAYKIAKPGDTISTKTGGKRKQARLKISSSFKNYMPYILIILA